ncbi:MAG: DUF1460 domain-containing protein [Leptolyngbyaceae cyanobacterium CSU_1_3]|nr:DUF1460 domain-containing protein [Leptolyngbyaceae cyanobacterium CSU_1_3]
MHKKSSRLRWVLSLGVAATIVQPFPSIEPLREQSAVSHSAVAELPPWDGDRAGDRVMVQVTMPANASANATAISTQDAIIFNRLMQQAIDQKFYQLPMGERMQAIAQQFIGFSYQGDLLDQSSQETLKISLQQFDCVLFVETVLAMARGISRQDYSIKTFVDSIQEQRYVNGEINGYCSRLHYFSEWILHNQKQGTITDLTPSLSGVPLHKTLNFMSSNWQKYPQLAHNSANRKCIAEMEANLDSTSLRYIPHSQIRSQYAALKPGDIVAIATDIPGLDVTHTGLVYRSSQGKVGLIHAAPKRGVIVSSDLAHYVGRVDRAIGILVARPVGN